MNKPLSSAYHDIVVESYFNPKAKRSKDRIHIRPAPEQPLFPVDLHVECSRKIRDNYPIGTRFRITAKLSTMKGKTYVYSSHLWSYEVML